MSSSILSLRLVLIAAMGAAVALTAPTPAAAGPADPTTLSQAVGLAIRDNTRQTVSGPLRVQAGQSTSHYVMRTDRSGKWAFGSAILHPAPYSSEVPEGWLFVARRTGSAWRVGLEYTPEFVALRDGAPASVLTDAERQFLAPKSEPGILAAPNDPYTGLMLPWPVGQSWRLTSGPHGNPRTAVDLAGGDGRVLSSGAGSTYAMCSAPGNPGWVRVYHATGFATDYYHLANNVNPGGAWLPRGTHLGNISNDVSCGGFSTGPHVHFSIYWGNTALPINNKTFGGWTFFQGANEREGFARRGNTTVNIGGSLFNYGVVEAAASAPRTDFNGDRRADIVTFTRGNSGDVYVATSNGSNAFVNGALWHGDFGYRDEVVLTGDFTGDGRDDIATFTRGSSGDVFVARSAGTYFVGSRWLWHSAFGFGNEIPGVGDVNGDGRDDIVVFTRGAAADVFVALSNGFSFGAARKWHDFFAAWDEFPALGDVNGDGRDDLITFTRDGTADVWVAFSYGSGFGPGVKFHDWFVAWDELPVIGDFNGDGRDDIAAFTRGPAADVYVGLSNGSNAFVNGALWHWRFAWSTHLPGSGDVDRDGRDDIVAFTRGGEADVLVARSSGSAFGSAAQWHGAFAFGDETPRPSSL